MKLTLILTEDSHREIYKHLYPGDGLEAVAICLCGRQKNGEERKLLVHKIHSIPYSDCVRQEGFIKWSTRTIDTLLKEASDKGLGILKIHSHPGGYDQFSDLDDRADKELFQSIYGWMDDFEPHASAVMLPNGEIFGRVIDHNQSFFDFEKVIRIGQSITSWSNQSQPNQCFTESEIRNVQTFGEGTIGLLKNLTIGIVGCSGTGSPVIEQLARLGVGKLILIDPDRIEEKNINRILNSTKSEALNGSFKVSVLQNAVANFGLGTEVVALVNNVYDRIARDYLTSCDIIFGCVDSVDGRHLLNQISTFYLIPYFDLGVKLIADGQGGVSQICGTVHYLIPGESSLLTRGVYSHEDLRSASLYRKNPEEFESLKSSGYISNVNVDRPAVISVNMLTASLAVNEFLARIHSFRTEPNSQFAITRFSLTDGYFQFDAEGHVDTYLCRFKGRGNMLPFLNMPELI